MSEQHPRRNPEAAFRAVGDDGGIVVLPEHSAVKVLNPVGAKIFSMLDGEHSRSAIVRAVAAEFEVTEAQAGEDFDRFIDELAREGMLAGASDRPAEFA